MLKKLFAIIATFLGAIFGAFGGAEGTSKGWRRFGIPGVLNIIGLGFKKFKSFFIWIWAGVSSIGYGIPDSSDEGSSLGRFWYKIFKGNVRATDVAVKGTIGFLYATVLAIIGLFKGNLGLLLFTAPLAILSHVIFGGFWQIPGEIKILGKKLTWNELLRFGTLSCAGIIQILWG